MFVELLLSGSEKDAQLAKRRDTHLYDVEDLLELHVRFHLHCYGWEDSQMTLWLEVVVDTHGCFRRRSSSLATRTRVSKGEVNDLGKCTFGLTSLFSFSGGGDWDMMGGER